MRLMGFARLCALVVAPLAFAGHAQALPKLQIHPVELVGYAGSALRLSVELPCGGAFYGLVTRAAKKGTLEVAAAVAQEPIVCTSLPRPTEIVVDYLATTGFKVIAPMLVDQAQNRLMVARIQDLKIVPATATHRAKLQAVYEPRCGKTVGALIRKTGARRLEVAIVEKGEGMPIASCSARQKTRTITSLDIKPRLKIAALRDKPTSLSRAFELRLAEVRAGSVRLDERGGLRLTYRRACNEAPVGVVLGQPVTGGGRARVAVGVLLARYYNYPCAGGQASNDAIASGDTATQAVQWEEMNEPSLTLPAKMDVTLVAATNGDLTLDTPLKIARQLGELKLTYAQPCGESFAVYGRDGRGGLAVGVLTRASASAGDGASSCKRAGGEVSLSQPFIASSVTPSGLAAMRLKGSLAH